MRLAMVPGSSAVEQATVNRLAGGSNPSRGANSSASVEVFFGSEGAIGQLITYISHQLVSILADSGSLATL